MIHPLIYRRDSFILRIFWQMALYIEIPTTLSTYLFFKNISKLGPHWISCVYISLISVIMFHVALAGKIHHIDWHLYLLHEWKFNTRTVYDITFRNSLSAISLCNYNCNPLQSFYSQ